MFKIHILFICTAPLFVNNLYLPADLEKAEEIQNAICTIATKELEATANATVTRQLKGVCTSNELNLKIDHLQTKILQEIDGIRYILEANGFKVPDVQTENPTSDFHFNNSTNINVNNSESVESKISLSIPETGNVLPRLEEILMYNDTVTDSEQGNRYFYYWKIENAPELLSKNDMYKSSPGFVVLGHTLHIQLYPNYLDSNHFAVVLKPNSNGFIKKHKLAILNQLDPALDLASGILYAIRSEDRMLKVSEKNLHVEGFLVQNSLVVKLEILLNS